MRNGIIRLPVSAQRKEDVANPFIRVLYAICDRGEMLRDRHIRRLTAFIDGDRDDDRVRPEMERFHVTPFAVRRCSPC